MVSEAQVYASPLASIVGPGDLFPLLGMVFALTLVLVLCFGGLSIAFVKALRGGGSTRRVREFEAQEAQAFQDLQRGFRRMEERLESLETLFIGTSQSRSYDREFE